ncbi:MAG: PG0541 family transporter-associated protein [Nitrospirota bacterium]
MQMLLVIFRQSLDEDIRRLLKDLDIKAFTEAPKVFGIGEAGEAFGSLTWPGHNSMILAAMEDQQAERVIGRLQAFRDHLMQQQGDTKIPLRVFVMPCRQVV